MLYSAIVILITKVRCDSFRVKGSPPFWSLLLMRVFNQGREFPIFADSWIMHERRSIECDVFDPRSMLCEIPVSYFVRSNNTEYHLQLDLILGSRFFGSYFWVIFDWVSHFILSDVLWSFVICLFIFVVFEKQVKSYHDGFRVSGKGFLWQIILIFAS